MGAVIRTRTPIPSRKALFDVGISGPIAGYIASMLVLAWGFSHLPGREFLLAIHPEYSFAIDNIPNLPPGSTLTMGSNLAYNIMGSLFSTPGAYIPPMHEMYHYPFLITGWFGMFVTALNLIPAGQLDGGHVTYALSGHRHGIIARVMVVLLASVGIMAIVPVFLDLLGNSRIAEYLVQMIDPYGAYFWPGWLLWAVLILVVIKIDHPPVLDETPPGRARLWIGIFAFIMFVTSLSPSPIFLK
jgi:membrane-associated protease RseP (regulator of RpoE activity)